MITDEVWLKKAVEKDQERLEKHPELGATDGGWASDGFRVHRLRCAPVPAHATWERSARVLEQAARAATQLTVSGPHFRDALRTARVFAGDLVIAFGPSLELGVSDRAVGDVRVELVAGDLRPVRGRPAPRPVVYAKEGPAVLCRFNARFVADALAGMGDAVRLAVAPFEGSHILYTTSENGREAAVVGLLSKAELPGKTEPEPASEATENEGELA